LDKGVKRYGGTEEMTLTINVESGYINVQDYKSGNNPTFRDVIILDKKAFLEEQGKVREWIKKK